MPQMAPINWILLFNIFVLTFIMFNILNYYNFLYSPKINSFYKNLIKMNWKW